MENAKNALKTYVIRPVHLPFIQEEMTSWCISDEMARRSGNNTKIGFLTDDYDIKDTIVKVRRREFDIIRRRV